MTTQLSKFSDLIKNASTSERSKILDDIRASAPSLPLADLKTLTAALSEAVRAQDSKNSKKALRLQRLQATIAGQDDDPEIEASVRLVRAELQRLGFGEINAHGQAGIEALEIHKRGKAANWDPTRITRLKIEASRIGLVE